MDFVILKINGRDVTNSSHEDTVRFFESAQEPITIQVLRMQSQCKSDTSTMPKIQTINEATRTALISTAVQTDLAGFVNEDYFDNYYVFEDGVDYEDEDEEEDDDDDEEEEVEFDEILSNSNDSRQGKNYKLGEDVYLEEVTLCKSTSSEKLGLTVSYNYAPDRDNSEAAEIYISEIARDSLTARDGRLREGDQILRVNGKDIESKEQTEKVFSQTKNTVTLLVSRCLNQNSPPMSPDNLPAYQNSMIEILMRHQQRQFESSGNENNPEHTENSPWSLGVSSPPPVPSHNIIVSTATATSVVTTSSSTCSSQNSYSSNKDTIKSQIALDRKHNLNESLKESSKKRDDLSMRNKPIMLTRASNTASDTEHIYETIPESDSEPIYSSPYESQLCINRINESTQPSNRSKSSKSNSSIEEKDSSSAYNTGESCNSNPLVLELHRADREHRGSTLVLCPPENIAGSTTPTNCRTRPPDGATRSIHSSLVTSQNRNPMTLDDKKSSGTHHHHHHHRHCQQSQMQQQPYYYHNRIPQNSLPDNRDRASSMNSEIMYTNIDNLERTMILQQQIFTQAINRKNITNREGRVKNSTSRGKFRAPNLTQYHFIGSQQVRASTTLNTPEDKCDPRMEWKVKRRPDGTRYIARRTVRNRMLGNRTLEISEERAGQTTEDDTVSEIKLGRYWTKDERKRHIEHARHRKQRHQSSLQHQHCKLRQCREFTNCDHH
ncbi:hypothetical protein PV327_002413 [Microctonus hyperodae]|uniref:PDZ domain-containing protein n=1 Tax=Microctonus hyperodae TaxID=165561 RepID=A0AA39FFN0_MICHY|nr:hypothetical protein PV327_002413 [Microctonus hyperodae]